MKIKNRLLLPILSVAALTSLISCGVDRWTEYAAETELDQWITTVMRQNYLWYADMPAEKELNFFTQPEAFLKSVVAKEDNNLSFIDTIRATPPLGYGYDYALYRVAGNDTAYNALITYILPHSPAAKAGLERGEWIMTVNNEYITKKSEPRLLDSGKAIQLLMGKYTKKQNEDGSETGIVVQDRTAELGAEQPTEENPINYHKVFTTSNGVKVGYLVYTHFTAGPQPDSQQYNDELRALSREFADAGVTQFILDLRYNTGGSLECVQLLNTLLAPSGALNTPMASLTYNDKLSSKNHEILFDPKLIATGANLNITQGFILSSAATTGVSGTLLNLLAPFNRWALVGNVVNSYGLATERYVHPTYPWSLNPVVCTVYNKEDDPDLGRTLSYKPNVSVDETANLAKFLPFGNEKEALLSVALGMIDGTYVPEEKKRSKAQLGFVKNVINTPGRKTPPRSTIR